MSRQRRRAERGSTRAGRRELPPLAGAARRHARRWHRDEAFSQVVYVTPDEMAGMAEVIRALIAQYRHRENRAAALPPGAAPVAVVARLFLLLEPSAGP